MKRLLVLFMCALSFPVLAVTSETMSDRGAFYLYLSSVSNNLATYTFMLEQSIELRCGKTPSIDYLKEAAISNQTEISLALKAGNYEKAKNLLLSIPCEQRFVR